MSPLWIIPSIVTIAGLALLTVALRSIGTAADDLREQFNQLGEFKLAVARLRAETAEMRSRTARVRD